MNTALLEDPPGQVTILHNSSSKGSDYIMTGDTKSENCLILIQALKAIVTLTLALKNLFHRCGFERSVPTQYSRKLNHLPRQTRLVFTRSQHVDKKLAWRLGSGQRSDKEEAKTSSLQIEKDYSSGGYFRSLKALLEARIKRFVLHADHSGTRANHHRKKCQTENGASTGIYTKLVLVLRLGKLEGVEELNKNYKDMGVMKEALIHLGQRIRVNTFAARIYKMIAEFDKIIILDPVDAMQHNPR
ncbi:hypothetical protein Tco_0122974 [Tanacetum coccineum]